MSKSAKRSKARRKAERRATKLPGLIELFNAAYDEALENAHSLDNRAAQGWVAGRRIAALLAWHDVQECEIRHVTQHLVDTGMFAVREADRATLYRRLSPLEQLAKQAK